MTCGIYLLGFNNTPKVYVGQSLNIEDRYKNHCYLLLKQEHSDKLNKAYLDFGLPTSIEILEECTSDNLNNLEAYYISLWDAVEDGFNTCEQPSKGPKLFGENNGKAKYTNEQVEEVFNLLNSIPLLLVKEISDVTKVTEWTIRCIWQGTQHTWLKEKYPDKYNMLMNTKHKRNSYSSSAIAKGIKYPKIISPTGIQYEVENTNEFAKIHNLNQGNLHSVLTGKRKIHKGWTLA